MANDYRILHSARISRSAFSIALQRGGSPAAPYANDCFAAIAGHGVDPALGLAVFSHESSMGRAGVAAHTRSWGNLRDPHTGEFKSYSSWRAGADDMGRLLAVYGHNAIKKGTITSTARTFPFVWAPAADHNAPAAYGAAIVASIDRYRAIDGNGPAYDATYTGSAPSGSGSSGGSGSSAGSTHPIDLSGLPSWLATPSHIITAADVAQLRAALLAKNPGTAGLGLYLDHLLPDYIGKPVSTLLAEAYGLFKPGGPSSGDLAPGPLTDVAAAIAGLPAALGDLAGGILVNGAILVVVVGLGWAGIRRILAAAD